MKWRSTFWLVAVAAILFVFIWGFERHSSSTNQQQSAHPLLSGLSVRDIDSVQLLRTNAFIFQIQRTNGAWEYVAPFSYPAQAEAVKGLIAFAETLNRDFLVSETDGAGSAGGTHHFGLENPQAVITFLQGSQRAELRLGARTLSSDQVYAQLVGDPSIYALPVKILDALPTSPNDWRERTLLHWETLPFDRFSVSNAALWFTAVFDRTNQVWVLQRPFPARAETGKVWQLLMQLRAAQVTQFVTDNPRADLEFYGLQSPSLELSLGADTQDIATVQFGNSPTNDSSSVYARLVAHNNVVLVPRTVIDLLRVSHTELRETQLLSFLPSTVAVLEVRGSENFSVRREGKDQWVVQPGGAVADGELMTEILTSFHQLKVKEFSKDFVTDFSPYGLAAPAYQWSLRGTRTNSMGQLTNSLLAQLDLGNRAEELIYVRRPEELSVYAIPLGDAQKLPDASWKLRDRHVWSFVTNDVVRVTVEQGGRKMQMSRSSEGRWTIAPGSIGNIRNTFALEETIYRLGQLRASVWTARGETNRAAYGFSEQGGHRITVETMRNGKTDSYGVEFGGRAPSRYTYAATPIEGTSWFFEFPLELYFHVLRDLSLLKIEGLQ